MKELFIQKGLREGMTIEYYMKAPFHLITRRHSKYPNLVLFKYDQIHSIMSNPLIQQCRGLILDQDDNWKCISRPFDKFFNYGEFNAAAIDWNKVRLYEKLDGTMIQMYYYDGEWWVGTTGTPDASGLVGMNGTLTFEELFWKTWTETGKAVLPNEHERDSTFIWELMTPLNRIVVDHKESRLQLLGVRNNYSGVEYQPTYWTNHHYDPVRFEELANSGDYKIQEVIADIKATFGNMDPLKQEGYVVCDSTFRRVKIKHPGYVTLHHAVSHFNDKYFFSLIRDVESNEFLAAFPEWKVKFGELQKRYDAFVFAIKVAWGKYSGLQNQKEFAIAIYDLPFAPILFMLRNGKASTPEIALRSCTLDRFVELLNRFEKYRERIHPTVLPPPMNPSPQEISGNGEYWD